MPPSHRSGRAAVLNETAISGGALRPASRCGVGPPGGYMLPIRPMPASAGETRRYVIPFTVMPLRLQKVYVA